MKNLLLECFKFVNYVFAAFTVEKNNAERTNRDDQRKNQLDRICCVF